MATLSLLPPDQPSSVPAGPTRSAPTNKQTSRAVHLEVPDRAVPTAANTERLPYTGMVGKAHRLAPRADVGFLSRLCLGWPPPWVRSSSESAALIKAKRHQSACRFLGRAWPQPSQRMCGDPRAHMGWPRPCTISNLPMPLADARGFTTGQAPSLPQGLSQWPHHCVRGQSWARPQEGTVWGQRGPELPVLGNLVHPAAKSAASHLEGPSLCPCSDGWVSAATAEVSGTEVYFQGELSVGPRPHTPPCTLPQRLPGGKEVETSLSHSPFMQFLSLKK